MLFLILFIPISVFAATKYLIPGGQNIGIMLKSNYVLVVGSYKIGNYDVLSETDLQVGDKITTINGITITNAKQLQDVIEEVDADLITVGIVRNNQPLSINIPLYHDGNVLKTGLYIRDSIRGVAAISYYDVMEDGTVLYGALGHEIVEKTSKNRFDADGGTIYSSTVTSVTKSSRGDPGEKNARSNSKDVLGTVVENTKKGVFGVYTSELPSNKKYQVANYENIKLGEAKMLTVIKGDKVEEFTINIIKVNDTSDTKNILFEVTDEKLLKTTGGIIQGMSGSPIIQGDYIIGAVNYVLVDSPTKGYGIFITNMLEEAYN